MASWTILSFHSGIPSGRCFLGVSFLSPGLEGLSIIILLKGENLYVLFLSSSLISSSLFIENPSMFSLLIPGVDDP